LIGQTITRGLGAGGYPEVAQKCAMASKDELREVLADTELLFVAAGMGGGTGTGSAPVIAEIAKDQGAIVVGVVTYPFNLERSRCANARAGIEKLQEVADTVIIVDNNLLANFAPNLPINQAFQLADEVTGRAIKGISDTIMFPSLMNIDFADVKATMEKAGTAMIAVGEGSGQDRVSAVVKNTLAHPLVDADYAGAKGALIHISGGPGLTLGEANEIGEKLTSEFDEKASVFFGARLSAEQKDNIFVTAIMTGIQSPYAIKPVQHTASFAPAPSQVRASRDVELETAANWL